MEAGGIIPYVRDRGVPFFCVRAVSDLADESFSNDFNAALGPDGRYRMARLIGSALMQPFTRFSGVDPSKTTLRYGGSKAREIFLTVAVSEKTGKSQTEVCATVPSVMRAAVYRGRGEVSVEQIPHSRDRSGRGSDSRGSLRSVPYGSEKRWNTICSRRLVCMGHETAGVVVRTGANVTKYQPGDRVIVFHHIPCGDCF